MMRNRRYVVALALCGTVLGAGAPTATAQQGRFDPNEADWAESFGGELTFTKPSGDAVMGFSVPTTVTAVLVEGGEVVEAGTILVRGEDAEQVAIVEQTRIRAQSDLAMRRAQKQAELAKLEFDRSVDAFEKGGVNQIEVDRARLTWQTAEIDVETAQLNMDLEQTRLVQAEALLDKYRLSSPFDAVVDEVFRDVGSSMDNSQPVVRVVQVDPLWIDVPAPTNLTMELGLTDGGPAWVLIDSEGEPTVIAANIIEVSPVADYASRSRRVRVEVPNPELMPSGLRCWVRFTEPGAEWTERIGGDPVAAKPE